LNLWLKKETGRIMHQTHSTTGSMTRPPSICKIRLHERQKGRMRMGKVISFMERTVETQIEELNWELEEYERTLEMTEKILEDAKRELEAELASRAKPGYLHVVH